MTEFWTATTAVASAVSAIVALIVVIINLNTIRKTNEILHMGSVPWIYVTGISRMGADAGIDITLKNDGNSVITIEGVKLIIVGTYKSLDLKYAYKLQDLPSTEIGRVFKVAIPRDSSFFEKECQIVIRYKNQYSKMMRSTSPKFDIFSGDGFGQFMSIERPGKESVLYRPFVNEID